MKADEELTSPLEGCVIGAAQHEAHRIAVTADERGVLLPRPSGTIAGEDMVNLLDGDRDAFHRRGRRDGFRLEIAPEPTRPRPGNRTPIVELGFPSVQLGRQVKRS